MATGDCEKFEELLGSYLEGELADAQKAEMDAHAATCLKCASIVADLRRIAREAASLPLIMPSRDLWSGIDARISAPVIPLTASRGQASSLLTRYGWTAAAAAALILTTAGVTYLATARSYGKAAQNPVERPAVAQTPAVQPSVSVAPVEASKAVVKPPRNESRLAGGGSVRRATPATNAASTRDDSWSIQADALYSREITTLERIVKQRNSTLDPATIAIIKRNLEVIDAAIEQSKAALARDPGSTLLYDQLTHTLDKKVDLLRTAAGLPSIT